MISHTVRYFKLIYIVGGILVSNKEICETVDQIEIATRVQVRNKLIPLPHPAKKLQHPTSIGKGKLKVPITNCWSPNFDLFNILNGIKSRLSSYCTINIWSLPEYVLECLINFLCTKIMINSDCDMIYK
uniref:Uncharacterized protein n=1 Tax=Glossina morsitans morsitans TaxID=37546 RepID=A0A1B0GCQ5_GLOMM